MHLEIPFEIPFEIRPEIHVELSFDIYLEIHSEILPEISIQMLCEIPHRSKTPPPNSLSSFSLVLWVYIPTVLKGGHPESNKYQGKQTGRAAGRSGRQAAF